MESNAYEYEDKPKYTRKDKWSVDGLNCIQTGSNCEMCVLFQYFGLHKDGFGENKCYQPDANSALIAAGIPFPKSKSITRKEQKPKATPQIIDVTIKEIPKIISKLGRDVILVQVVEDLNSHEGGFHGHVWTRDTLYHQMKKLVFRQVLSAKKINGTYYYNLIQERGF